MATSSALDGYGSGSISIPDVVRLAGEGTIRIPTFQRAFSWDAANVRELFDSVYRGFPVGTLLLWRREAPTASIRFGPIEFMATHRTDGLWVVDGQQRITSLFATLSPDHLTPDERFNVYFDFATSRFVNPRHGVVPPRAIPVREALETRRLLTWLRQHEDELEISDFDAADRLGGTIRDYKIPTFTVAGEDQDLLRTVFDRVNSAGRKIKRAEVFHALFANDTEPGSPATVVRELSGLGFGKVDDNRVVQSLLAIRSGNVQRDIHDEFANGDDPAEWYDITEQALSAAIHFLKREGVPHIALMPSTLPLPVLAAIFHLHPNPDVWVVRLISRWLWRGWAQGFGRESGQTPTLRRAIMSVNPRPTETPSAYEAARALLAAIPESPVRQIPLQTFNMKNADSRLVMLALATLQPLNSTGGKIDLSTEFEKRGSETITSIFPRHRSEAAARSFWPMDHGPPTGLESAEILNSHAINSRAAEKLESSDVEGFLAARRTTLRELVDSFLESRLEPEGLVRPPLGDLIVSDDFGDFENPDPGGSK